MTESNGTQTVIDQAQALLADASAVNDNALVQVLIFCGARGRDLQAFRLNPSSSLGSEFRDNAVAWANDVSDRYTLVRYTPGRTPSDHEMAIEESSKIPPLPPVLQQLSAPLDLDEFDPESKEAKRIRFYVVALESDGVRTYFFRALTAAWKLKRSWKVRAVFTGAVFDRLEEEPFLFDTRFDAVVRDPVAGIANQRSFESSLEFLSEAGEAAIETLESIASSLTIKHLDQLRTAVSSDINMIAKLRSIDARMASNPAYAKAMTMERVVEFVKGHPELQIDIEGEPGKEQLVFHSDLQRRWRILKLLDDDFLRSQLTEMDYEANSKSMLT